MGDDASRVAGELHDGAMQEVTLARLQLDLLCASVGDDSLAGELGRLSDELGEVAARMQELMCRLGPHVRLV
jgi:signal transduction histidine kinase